MDNKPKVSDFVHQTVSRREAHGLGMSLIETTHSVKNGAPTKSREHFLCLLVLYKKETSFSASVDKAFFLQPVKTAAMCTEYGALTKSREHFLRLLVLYKKETSFSASVNKAFFLQPAKTAAMCTEYHDYACPPPTFCSTKLISKTN